MHVGNDDQVSSRVCDIEAAVAVAVANAKASDDCELAISHGKEALAAGDRDEAYLFMSISLIDIDKYLRLDIRRYLQIPGDLHHTEFEKDNLPFGYL